MAELARLPTDIVNLVTKFSNPKLYLLWYRLPLIERPFNDHDHLILVGAYTDFVTCVINLLSRLYLKVDPYDGDFPGQPHLYTSQGWVYHYPELSDYENWQSHKEITDIEDFVITYLGTNEFMNKGNINQKWFRLFGNRIVKTSPYYSIYLWIRCINNSHYAVPNPRILNDPNVEVLNLDIPALNSFHFISEDQYLMDSQLTMILLWIRGIHPDTPEDIKKKFLIKKAKVIPN